MYSFVSGLTTSKKLDAATGKTNERKIRTTTVGMGRWIERFSHRIDDVERNFILSVENRGLFIRRSAQVSLDGFHRHTGPLLCTCLIMSDSASKRRRIQRSPSPVYKLDDTDAYEPYVPVAQRRQAKIAKLSSWGANGDRDKARRLQEEMEEKEDEEMEEVRRREKARKERTLLMEAQEVHSKKAAEGAWRGSSCVSSTLMPHSRCKEDRRRKDRRGRSSDSCCYCEQKKTGVRYGAGQRHPVYRSS